MRKLDDALKEHYRNKSLSDGQLMMLQELSVRDKASNKNSGIADLESGTFGSPVKSYLPPGNARHGLHYGFAYAACLMVVCFGFLISTTESHTQRIMGEIVDNHRQPMILEVTGATIKEVAAGLLDLDFQLKESRLLGAEGWKIIGGRYCTIDEKSAAQLKVKNLKDGRLYTHYQTTIPEDFKTVKQPLTSYVEDVNVKIWTEGGLLMGLAVYDK